uniref:Uncharacterized protein n=1 Tax=Oryza nivara TaxID=4536 RepID=A0A0E0J9W7_ORYNI
MEIKLLMVFLACLLSSINNRGEAASCSLENIVVKHTATGGWAHGQPEYAVTVSNMCGPASRWGFDTTLAVDPAKLRPAAGGNLCLVNSGDPVVQGHDITFSYTWSSQFKFTPVSSTVKC